MKYFLSFFGVMLIVCAIFFCGEKNQTNDDYLRIHITANSSSNDDQNMKYVVKDAVVDFLIPLLAEVDDSDKAQEIIEANLSKIEEVVKQTLKNNNACYGASVSLTQEQMPARSYDNLTLESGIYKSLKIDLGDAQGDNWWCVVFPAVCFVDTKNFDNLVYISKIWEIINNVTKKGEN